MLSHPQLKHSANTVTRPQVLYRGDIKSPLHILEAGGFISEGTDNGVIKDHIMSTNTTHSHTSAYITTSSLLKTAINSACPLGRAKFQPASWFKGSCKVAEGWVYEIEPTDTFVSVDAEAGTEEKRKITTDTKEWVAVRKINIENVIRATKYRRQFPLGKTGAPTNLEPPFQKLSEKWENPEYVKGAPGYSALSDTAKLFDGHAVSDTVRDHEGLDVSEAKVLNLSAPSVSEVAGAESAWGMMNWNNIRKRAKETVKAVISDPKHTKSLPPRKPGGLSREETLKVVETTKNKITSRNGAFIVAGSASVVMWALGMAKIFSDRKTATLGNVIVRLPAVPGIRQALGIANGIKNREAETVVVNAISLAALAAAQAMPVVGEFVDTVILVDMVVEAVWSIFKGGSPSKEAFRQIPAHAMEQVCK